LLVLVLALSGLVPAMAQDSRPAATFNIKQDDPSTGTHIRQRIVTNSVLPLDKTYEQLTPEQQAWLKSEYENIAPGDEPPYPRHGLAPIYKAVSEVQQKLDITGDLTLFVDVDGEGRPVSVSVLQSPDPQMTRAAAAILMLQEYKPAVCGGKPCRMQFPFRTKLTRR
jgi:hypothetical protein